MRNTGEGAKPPLRYSLNLSAHFRVWVTVWVRRLTHILTHTFFSIFATKSIETEVFDAFLELLGRFELPTSSLPSVVEPSIPCCIRLCGVFCPKRMRSQPVCSIVSIRTFPRVGHGVGQAETSASKKPRTGFIVIFRFAVSLS